MIQNIKNIKILKISCIASSAFLGGVFAFLLNKWSGFLSFEIALISFFLVFLGIFTSMRTHLKNIKNFKESQEDIFSLREKISLGFNISISILRIFAYIILVVALIVLLKTGFFNLSAYLLGILFGLFGIIVLYVF